MRTSSSSYVTLMTTQRTPVVVGAQLRAPQRERAACLADNFIISLCAVSGRRDSAACDIRPKSVSSCAARGERA